MEQEAAFGNKTEKISFIAVCAVLILFFALFAYINFAGFIRCAQADMYEDTLIAKLMWDQKTLFPNGYTFGNQFYVIATPVFAALFYGLTGSINTGMALATTLMSVLIVLTLIWMLRPAVKSPLMLACALLILAAAPFSPELIYIERAQLFFVMCSYYACYLITLFFVFGDYIRARADGVLRPAALAVALFLCFCTGMQSLRQTCIMTLPLLAYEGLALLRESVRARRSAVRAQRAPLLRVCAYFAANIAGVIFIRLLDVPHQTIFTAPPYDSRLHAVWRACRTISGFDTVALGKSPLYALMFGFYIFVLLFAAVLVLCRRERLNSALVSLWTLCVISILAVMAASLVTEVSIRDIYLFIYYPLLALSFITICTYYASRLRAALALILCLLSLCNIPLSYGDTLTRIADAEPTAAESIAQYALDNGYRYIYGQDVSAPFVAVCADGRLLAGMWEHDVIFKAVPYLNIMTIYSLDDYARALFVFQDEELEQARIETEGNGAALTVIGRFGEYTVCTSSKQLMYPLTWDYDWPQYFKSAGA